MITVYDGDKSIKNKKCIKFVDLTFDSIIYNLKITDKDREYMKYVDNAIYKGNGYIYRNDIWCYRNTKFINWMQGSNIDKSSE